MAKKVKEAKSFEQLEQERLQAKNEKKARHIDSRPFAEISDAKIKRRSKTNYYIVIRIIY